jgi:hypothetical protein
VCVCNGGDGAVFLLLSPPPTFRCSRAEGSLEGVHNAVCEKTALQPRRAIANALEKTRKSTHDEREAKTARCKYAQQTPPYSFSWKAHSVRVLLKIWSRLALVATRMYS